MPLSLPRGSMEAEKGGDIVDFKIDIFCNKCKCSYELRPTEFKDRAAMECPNCGQAFPAEVYKHLKIGVTELGMISESICAEPESAFFSEELFTVRVKGYGALHNLLDKPEN